jgi:hypothetical protein
MKAAPAKFAALVDTLISTTDGRVQRINSTSIKTNGKMFAWLKGERLVLKLPPARVEELVSQGQGELLDPGNGQLQKGWLVLKSTSLEEWLDRATEAEQAIANSR